MRRRTFHSALPTSTWSHYSKPQQQRKVSRLEPYVDQLLQEAWKNKEIWEPEIRLLDRIGETYGYFSPRSLAEIAEQSSSLPDISSQVKKVSQAWKSTLSDANRAYLERFQGSRSAWNDRLEEKALKHLEREERDKLRVELLGEMSEYDSSPASRSERINVLHNNGEDSGATSYRMEVRLGVILRMHAILITVAGQHYVDHYGDEKQKQALAALQRCEDLRIPPAPTAIAALSEPEPFPAFDKDVASATAALPAWIGIRFRDVQPETRKKLALPLGPARVLTVYPDSPAATAGLQVGDIATGVPGKAFDESRQIRGWAMLSKVGESNVLDIIRDGEKQQVTIVPKPYPLKWPDLPGPPKVGEKAPPLPTKLSAYRGKLPEIGKQSSALLFFWATWCGPCKAAIPELLEFEKAMKIPVIAITDEPNERLDPFFEKTKSFPQRVAIDSFRQSFLKYGVSGTPTFVLIDETGTVDHYSSGYIKKKGLAIDAWRERKGEDEP